VPNSQKTYYTAIIVDGDEWEYTFDIRKNVLPTC
jgi:hypothetical protein